MTPASDPVDHAFTLAAELRRGVCRNRVESETLVGVATVIQTLVGEYVAFESNPNVARLRETIDVDLEALVNHIDTLGAAYHGSPTVGDDYLAIAYDLDDLALACAQVRQTARPRSDAAPVPHSIKPAVNDG